MSGTRDGVEVHAEQVTIAAEAVAAAQAASAQQQADGGNWLDGGLSATGEIIRPTARQLD